MEFELLGFGGAGVFCGVSVIGDGVIVSKSRAIPKRFGGLASSQTRLLVCLSRRT